VAWSAVLGYAFDFYNLIIMAFLLVPIQKSLGVGLADTGLIVSMTLAASVLGGILFGWLGDRIGRKQALLATLLLLAAGSLLSAFAWSFASLLIFRVITGIGVGGEWGAGMVLLNEVWDNRRRGFGSAVVQAMSSAGTAMASIAATVALANLNPDTARRFRGRRCATPVDAVRPIQDARIAAVAGISAPQEGRRAAAGKAGRVFAADRDLQRRVAEIFRPRDHRGRRLRHQLSEHQHFHADIDVARSRYAIAGVA
jgi:MFS family permease